MTGARAAQALYDSEATLRLVALELGELRGSDDEHEEQSWATHIDDVDTNGPTLNELLRKANCEIGDVLQSLGVNGDPAAVVALVSHATA